MPSGQGMPSASSGSLGTSGSSGTSQGTSSASDTGSSGTKEQQPGSNSQQGQSNSQTGISSSDQTQSGSSQTESQGSAMGSISGSDSASSVFDESLGVFDQEMASERIVIASSGEGPEGMSAQEAADASAVQSGVLEGEIPMENASGESSIGEAGDQDQDEASSQQQDDTGESSHQSEQMKERIPDDIPMDGTGEDVIARQIREAAIQEDDPEIREALWDEYRKHMGIR
jgi:hypothetical protein